MKMCMLFLKHKKISWVASCLLMMCLGFLHSKLRAQVIAPPPKCNICACIETEMWQPLFGGKPLFLKDSFGVINLSQALANANTSNLCGSGFKNIGTAVLYSATFINLDCPLSPIAVTTGTFPATGPGPTVRLRATPLNTCTNLGGS